MDNLGAHMSVSGGLHNAFGEAQAAGAHVVQIFSKNSNQWAARPLEAAAVKAWLDAWQSGDVWQAVVHDSYLINLGSPDDALWERSIAAFEHELERCAMLRIPYLVMHPGAHMKMGEDFGVQRIAAAFNRICHEMPDNPTTVLIENTAGQGTCLGYKFGHIADIMGLLAEPERFGVCLDTCHALAGGYDFRSPEGYAAMVQEIDDLIGCDKIRAFHLNDSKKDCCSRVDRHEHIGQGFVGLEPFRFLMNDTRFFDRPMCLETPKTGDMDRVNLAALRGLRDEAVQKKVSAAVKKAATAARKSRASAGVES